MKQLPLQPDKVLRVGKQFQLPAEHHRLGHHRGQSRAPYAPAQHEDEQRGEDAVEDDGAEGGVHGQPGAVGGTQHGVQAEIEVGYHIAGQYHLHKMTGIGQSNIARPEKAQDGIDEKQQRKAQEQAQPYVHQHHVAQDAFGCAIVALPQFHAHQRGRAHAHHGPESRRERHERPRQRQSHDGLRTHALTNEDAIDDVIHR